MRCRLDLCEIDGALLEVERAWPDIDAELQRLKIGRKDPFTSVLHSNMLSAYAYLDELVARDIAPFSPASFEHMLVLNDRVHYGMNRALMAEFASAIDANAEKFNTQIEPIAAWYAKHAGQGDHPCKLAAETYVSIVGQPQLFIEGNHRTGSLIASWINLYNGHPPFVLAVDNAVDYFAPSAAIKQFANRSTWRGRQQLPKYRKSFRIFWEHHVDEKYVLKPENREPFHGG
ncbi:MAG: hypothetical protein JO057_20120 [Chloroflexi bacterium]|nr:hypothetical protein [Chloroflexota bacterium]